MNTAVRVAVRVGMDRGHTLLGVRDGFRGLAEGRVEELDVDERQRLGRRGRAPSSAPTGSCPAPMTSPRIADQLAAHAIDGLLLIGGWAGYVAAHELATAQPSSTPGWRSRSCASPPRSTTICPASDLSIGADTALNSIMTDVDKIKQSAVASHRCFVVEVMGRRLRVPRADERAGDRRRAGLPPGGGNHAGHACSSDLDALRAGFRSASGWAW